MTKDSEGKTTTVTTLENLSVGEKATIEDLEEGSGELKTRLMEMGFLKGSEVEMVLKAPLIQDPMSVRVRGTIYGLRKNEARFVRVRKKLKGN